MPISSVKTRVVKVCPHCGKSFDPNGLHTCAATPPEGSREARKRAADDPLIGATLGDRYEIKERLSQGGMGVVYKARHKVLGRSVAVKIMLKQKDEPAQERFLQEAKIASTLTHPNIVYISDFGVLDDGRSYIVMEYLQGQTLSKVLQRGRLSPLRSCQIAEQIADGLQAVHEKGIIHRDLKPDNILLLAQVSQSGREDFVKILDFGIALAGDKRPEPLPGEESALARITDAASEEILQRRFTVPGMVMGTPAYMSPEQAQGEELDGRSDQYALGCMLYEMLVGSVPFDHRRNVAKVLMGHITGRVVPITERVPPSTLPPSLDTLVLRLLAKRPEQRFENMAEVCQALGQEIKGLLPAGGEERRGVSRPAPVAAKLGGLRPRARRALLLMPLGLCLLGGGAYLGYRVLTRPVDQAVVTREMQALRQQALAVLKAQLQTPELELRLRAITSLGESHEAAVRALLEPLLNDSDLRVQSRAAEALGELGDRGAVAPLRQLTEKTRSASVRVAAAGALDQLGDASGQKLLHEDLVGNDPDARLQAALLLCSASEVEAQNVLRGWLRSVTSADDVFVNTLYRMASVGDIAARNQLLSRLERGGRPEVQLAAAASLARLGEERGRALLREAASRKDKEQVLAARLLASVDASTDLTLFRTILANRGASVAALIAATDGIADAGQSDDARALAEFLNHPDARLRLATASAIVELTGRDPAALSEQSLAWAEGALSDRSSEIRSSAVAALGDAGNKVVPLLQRVLIGDSEPAVRRAAARALSRRQDSDALRALHLGLTDGNADVRKETLRGIERVGTQLRSRGDSKVLDEVKSWLTPLFSSKNLDEQILASGILYKLGDTAQRSRLTQWLTSVDATIRRLALDQLVRDRDLIAAVLTDREPAVRFTAARMLAELGDRRGASVLTEMVGRGGLDGLSAYALLRKLGIALLPPKDLGALRFSADVRTRRAALEALAALPLGEQRPLLLAAARDHSAEVRLRSAELAAELPLDSDNLPGGLSILRALLYDSDIVVRTRASALLSRLLRPIAEREIAAAATAPRSSRPALPGGARDGGAPEGSGFIPDGGCPGDSGCSGDGGWPVDGGTAGDRGDSGAGAVALGHADANASPDEARLPELVVEQYLSGGTSALEHKEYTKAQKLLERASTLCVKKGKRWKECARLGPEITWLLGSDYEAQGQLVNAATEYQKLLPPYSKKKSERQKVAQTAIHRLSARLGRIEISKVVDGRCEQGTMWMEPGQHFVGLGNGQSKPVNVQAGQTTELKTCVAKGHGGRAAEKP